MTWKFGKLGCYIAVLFSLALFAAEPSQTPAAKPAPGKSYQIRNKKYGDLLRPLDANSANGTPIVLYPAQAWKCMTWKLSPAGESAFALQNHFTSKTFAPKEASGSPAAVAQVPFGKTPEERPAWQITALKDGASRIAEAKTGNVLTAIKGENGLRIEVRPWADSDDQKWEMIEIDPKTLTM